MPFPPSAPGDPAPNPDEDPSVLERLRAIMAQFRRAVPDSLPPLPLGPAQFQLGPLVDKLIATYPPVDEETLKARYVSDPVHSALLQLTGIPIEEYADRMQRYYTEQVRQRFEQLRELDPAFHPDHWNIIAPTYLFVGAELLFGVRVEHNRFCPEWQVFLLRSPQWWEEQLRTAPFDVWAPQGDVRSDLMDLYHALDRNPYPYGVPPDDNIDPTAFIRITGV